MGILLTPLVTAAAAKLLQSCPTLCDPIDGSPPGSSVPGILLLLAHADNSQQSEEMMLRPYRVASFPS